MCSLDDGQTWGGLAFGIMNAVIFLGFTLTWAFRPPRRDLNSAAGPYATKSVYMSSREKTAYVATFFVQSALTASGLVLAIQSCPALAGNTSTHAGLVSLITIVLCVVAWTLTALLVWFDWESDVTQ